MGDILYGFIWWIIGKLPFIWRKLPKQFNTFQNICKLETLQSIDKISNKVSNLIIKKNTDKSYAKNIQEILEAQKEILANLIDINSDKLHLTLKRIIKTNNQEEVYTIARSARTTGWDNRRMEIGDKYTHKAEENSSFASTLRVSDGLVNWSNHNFELFVCGDLKKSNLYKSSGHDWHNQYNATITVPIRKELLNGSSGIVGYFTVDSKGDIFEGLNIYNYLDKHNDYLEQALKQPIISSAKVFANIVMPLFN